MIDVNYPALHISNEGDKADSSNHTLYLYVMKLFSDEGTTRDPRPWYFDQEGNMRRHPDMPSNSFTRDQLTPHLAYMALTGVPHRPTINYYKRILNNGGFFFNSYDIGTGEKPWWNRDFLDLQTRALFARATGTSRWMHYLGDINMLATVLFDEYTRPDYNAQENLQMHLITSRLIQPTFISKHAFNFYFYRTKKLWKFKIIDFFSRGGTYYPEIPEIAIKAINKILDKVYHDEY